MSTSRGGRVLVAPHIRLVPAPNPSPLTGLGTNTYLIGEREVVVVDPGPDISEHVEATLDVIRRLAGRIAALLVTHGHRDHLPAAYRLRERTAAPILAHQAIPEVDRPLENGDEVVFDSCQITAYETPGHSNDHLCFWMSAERLLFAGDLVAGSGTIVLSDTPGSLTQYLASLETMLGLDPLTILPGHGPMVPDGPAKIQEYLTHRARRERQIMEVLRHGPATVEALVRRLYVDIEPELYPLAARNVGAHLDLLARKRQVTSRDGKWALSPVSPGH